MDTEAICYQFDSVEVQPAAFAVVRDGQTLALEPKAVRVLLYLIEHRDRAVSKEELIETVWEGVAVTDNALTRIVAQLRRELGDDAKQTRYIQTLPTLGYRFIADLRVVPPQQGAAPSSRKVVFGSAAALMVAIFAGSLWLLAGRGAVTPSLELQPVQVTTAPGVDICGSFSPDGNSFVYSSNRSGWFEIYVRPARSGAAQSQVTSDGKQNVEPAWSPDGRWIAYRSVAQHGIWLVPAAGGVPKRLTAFGSSPAWSPDSKQIAFRSLEPYSLAWFDFPGVGESTIWTVAADGSQLRRITSAGNPRGQHALPGWSRDGKRVAFSALGALPSLWTVDASSGELKALTPDTERYFAGMVFAPDGVGFYSVGISKGGNFGVYHFRRPGEKPVELYSTRNDVPMGLALTPDGRRLLFSRIANVSQLWVTGSGVEAAKPIYEDAVIRARLPSFSPDGKRLAYVVRPAGRTDDVWVMNADGSGAAPVTDDPGVQAGASWNAEGTAILYCSSKGTGCQVRRINPEDRSVKVIQELPQRAIDMPHVTTDEQDLIFVRPSPPNVWKLHLKDGSPKQLTFDREGASFPAPSWDGQWIAYEVKRGENTQIGVMDRDGGHQELLTDDPALNWSNSWASDNRRIAYASYRDGVWNLYWIDRVTRERRQITSYTAYGAFVRNPAWRPGTEQVVYEYSHVKGNIYLVNLP
jgi:Tol biopolymer transport system component/DNA-binding winged helix-turn-helix (wHTH) protein